MNILSKLCCIAFTIVPLITFADEVSFDIHYYVSNETPPYKTTTYFSASGASARLSGADGSFTLTYDGDEARADQPIIKLGDSVADCYCKFRVFTDPAPNTGDLLISIEIDPDPKQICKSGRPVCEVNNGSGPLDRIRPDLDVVIK